MLWGHAARVQARTSAGAGAAHGAMGNGGGRQELWHRPRANRLLGLLHQRTATYWHLPSTHRADPNPPLQFLHNVSINLKDGGYFIGTVPDGKMINACIRHGKVRGGGQGPPGAAPGVRSSSFGGWAQGVGPKVEVH